MQYVWQHRLWPSASMKDTSGARVDIIDPGLLNTGSGPDFFNAKVSIDGRMWAGNVEIHVKASDWFRHGHHNDRAYDSVVLHVVAVDDAAITRPDGSAIPQVVMQCAPDFRSHYDGLISRPYVPVCAADIPGIPSIHITAWLEALAHDRLFRKSARAAELAAENSGDWATAIYVMLARALGFGTNAEPFERLALAMPLKTLLKHADSPVAVEAMLFGQAGFLEIEATDDYTSHLQQEYAFMKAKFDLKQPVSLGWKTGRMRPQNLPYRRLALLAAMVAGGFKAGYKMLEIENEEQARELFGQKTGEYWRTHYRLGARSASNSAPTLGNSAISLLIINVVAPVLFAYGAAYANDTLQTRALDLLGSLAPESNSIVKGFTDAGVKCPDALTSQAMIELRRNYCETRKCLFCRIGHKILSKKSMRTAPSAAIPVLK